MKDIKTYILEGWRNGDTLAPQNVQKFLGLKYANGAGGGDTEEKLSFVGSTGSIYQERGKIEGQDKVFAVQSTYSSDITDKDASIYVCTTSRPMAKKLTYVAFYTTNEEEAKDVLKDKKRGYEWFKTLEKIVVCKDTDDVVYNIRNDYGKVTSYRNIGHGEEKDGIIYSAVL